MKFARRSFSEIALVMIVLLIGAAPTRGQAAPAAPPMTEKLARQKLQNALPIPQGFKDYVKDGKLQLSLADAIQLAMENNTDIQLDKAAIDTSRYAIGFARGPFDPILTSNFNAQRTSSETLAQTSGGPVTLPGQLSQNYQLSFSQMYETGTNLQVSLGANKASSAGTATTPGNLNVQGALSFSFSQPLLRGAWLLPNRAPILIAQRNLRQSLDTFKQEVSGIILNVVGQYWNVVDARESLVVQQKSLDEAQQSYDHDKLMLEKGALPPLNIYRSQSQVAARRVTEIQAEYALKQEEDAFRRVIGADIDLNIRALDLNLTEPAEPPGELMSMDIATALDKAMADRPELEAQRLQLANDELNIKIAHNGLEPNLSLTGTYESVGSSSASNGPFSEALSNTFGFGSPIYGAGLSLNFPIKNHSAEAALGTAEVTKRRDLYSQRQLQQQITLDVSNSVRQLEQSKLSMEAAKIALDLAQKNLQAEERRYQLADESLYVVLQTQTELASAEESLLQSQVQYQLAVVSVDNATGGLLDHFGVKIESLAK
ncbi:MAG TPA: TolC family protein [Candidatus Acidoferrales bacterium]|nr:TolC family protein [Candidatus Acidoferrales bacterium]